MHLFICALRSPAGKGLTSWLSFVVSYCEFVTLPLVSWVRCGTRVIFYVRRNGLYLYKYRIYGAISIYILKGLAFVYQLM